MRADHTRMSALEVNIAIRNNSTTMSDTGSTSTAELSTATILQDLKWLAEISSIEDPPSGADASRDFKEIKDKKERRNSKLNATRARVQYEAQREQGLHGSQWVASNLHSKLETNKWPLARNLQSKAILFLTTTLFGEEFATEYTRMLFMDTVEEGAPVATGSDMSETGSSSRKKAVSQGVGLFKKIKSKLKLRRNLNNITPWQLARDKLQQPAATASDAFQKFNIDDDPIMQIIGMKKSKSSITKV